MAKGGCLVAAALAAASWRGSASRALADPAAARVDRGTRRWPWLNRLRRKSDEGEPAAAPDESPRTRRALTACDAGSFWSLATATCEVCGSGEFSASGAAACTRCGDRSYELEDNAWPAESRTVDVGACACPASFPYQSTVLTDTCFNSQAYASAGTGPCGSWCTFKVGVGSGCGHNSDHMCPGSCNLGSVPTPRNYEISFTIDIDSAEPFSGWTNIFQVTSVQDGWVTERYPGIWFEDGGYLHVAQSYQRPSSTLDYASQTDIYGDVRLQAGKTYYVKVTNVDSLLSMSIYKDGNLIEEQSKQGASTYVPAGGAGVLYAGSPWFTKAKATLSDVRYSEIIGYALNDDNLWPAAQSSPTVDVGACQECTGYFPYQHHSMPQICYTDASYATAGGGPCGSWCTLDVAVGSGCGDNSGRICTGSCNLGAVATPMNYELSFTIDIDPTEPFSGWTNILAITSAENGWDVERYPSIFFGDGGYLHLAQTYRKPTSSGDWNANCYSDSDLILVAGNTYGIKVTHVDNLLSMYIYDQDGDLVEEKSMLCFATYSPPGGGVLHGASPWHKNAKATLSEMRFSKFDDLLYDASAWDPNQKGLTSQEECQCASGLTGTDCHLSECAPTTAAASLGFLLLEVQWPRHARVLSRNEAFSGVSAAFRAFDANSDNHLSVEEARTGIANGGMAAPLEVAHIWSRDNDAGGRAYLYEDDVTITDMIQDELDRLEAQGTKEYYDRPSGSGEIPVMEATYPSPLTTDDECGDRNEANPLLEWTVDRSKNVIFQQCAYYNGEALSGDKGLANEVSSGADCSGSDGDSECDYQYELPKNFYTLRSNVCTAAGVISYEGQTLNCIELPNGEFVGDAWPADSTTVDVGSCCPADFPYPHVSLPEICYNDASYTAGGPCGSWCTLDAAVGSGCGDNSEKNMCSGACPAAYPYPHVSIPEICYNDASYTTAGGPCGSWCTFDAAVGSGCGDNSGRICSACNRGSIPTPENYELSFTITIDPAEPFSGWTNIFHITSAADGLNTERYPGIWFGDGGYLHVAQSYRKPSSNNDWNANCYSDSDLILVAGNTYSIKVTYVRDLLSTYIYDQNGDLVEEKSIACATYSPPGGGVLHAASPWFTNAKATLSDARFLDLDINTIKISKQSYCVETKFCPSGTTDCDSAAADPKLTVTRCTTGLQYDGTPMDVFPRMMGKEGVSISWLDTRFDDTSGYRVYKYDASVPFAEDTSARLLKEISLKKADCGLTHNYLDFRDATTGSEPGLEVGYAIVPLDDAGDEIKDKVGVGGFDLAPSSSGSSRRSRRRLTGAPPANSGFTVTWWGDILVTVKAEGGGPVEDVTVKLTHLIDDGTVDETYREFVEEETDAYGEAVLKVRVTDQSWTSLTQHFRVTLEKTSPKADGGVINHQFSPASEDLPLRHLAQPSVEFKDVTSSVISGTVSHAGFDAAWFADDCPHKKSEDTGECMCPVDGVKVMITREGAGVEPVTLNDGKFSTAVVRGETVTLWLEQYTGTSGTAPHYFSVTDDTGNVAATTDGISPTFMYTADNDAVVDFLDESTVGVSARLVHGAPQITAKYVNGLPVVTRVERCGWQRWDWTLGGEIALVLGAATEVEMRTLGEDEIDEARYYHPLSGTIGAVDDCSLVGRSLMVSGTVASPPQQMIRGCRVEIPHGSATASRPCSTNAHTYVDELPEERNFPLDLSNYASSTAGVTVDFVIESPLCVAKVKATPVGTLKDLLDSSLTRTDFSLKPDGDNENLLLLSELPVPEVVPNNPYGKACTDNTDAVFREGDVVDFTFELKEREPNCDTDSGQFYPWDHDDHGGNLCVGYGDATPSADSAHEIKIRVADGVSKSSPPYTADVYGKFKHKMEVGKPNPFAPFSHELSVEITRAFDGAKILFVRHALVLGSIPEEVPQVWTVATNPTLIFSIIRDPPGGASTATLVEGSTISTSMAIDGAHAAQLEDSWQIGTSVGAGVGFKSILGGPGLAVEQNVVTFGGSAGFSYAHTPTDVTVSRSSSRHFDIGITFSTAITTSDSPYLAGQPSDVIVGGGANLRFISSIEIYAEKPTGDLCVYGRSLLQFLPEQVSTWVMSVYEIEKTIERIGAALADTSTKMENVDTSLPEPKDNLAKQIENWQTVLANYRAVTGKDQAESVASALQQELTEYQDKFREFLAESVKKGNTKFREFLSDGLNEMEKGKLLHDSREHQSSGVPGFDMWEGKAAEKEEVMDRPRLNTFEKDTLGRVNAAYMECVASVELPEPGGEARLCDVYQDIYHGINVTSSLLSGICEFKDASASANEFCKRKKYWPEQRTKVIGAFDALHDTEQFVTFSGTTGLELSWDVAESKGQEFSSTHDAAMTDAIGGSLGFGADVGRRRLGSTDKGVPGYAYPTTGKVLAVSKKLLEVTPEALEERRRRLQVTHTVVKKGGKVTEAPGLDSNPCRRRLNGAKVSGEERRRLGVTACVDFEGGTSSSFSVSLGRAANKEAEHTHSIAVSLKDDNIQDVFAVKISQDTIYGTPIFTTMGGRSSCPGETGTTRRDSRVTIKEIKPLCASQEDVDRSAAYDQSLCPSALTCECKDLEPGQDAIFSVVLENLSPWVTSVTYLLRAVNGASTAWDSGKYARVAGEACPPGDLGSLLINPLGSDSGDLRNGEGEIIAPLPYGQFEVRLLVSRRDFAPQCFSYSELELELVSVCEDTDWDGNQDVYQYRTSKPDPVTGNFEVVHPRFVGRPVGDSCASSVTLDPSDKPSVFTDHTGTEIVVTDQGTEEGWCYSEVNRAMGCTASPKECWEKCSEMSLACETLYVWGTPSSDGTYTSRQVLGKADHHTCWNPTMSRRMIIYECTDCDERRVLRYHKGYWYIMRNIGNSGCGEIDDPGVGLDWCDCFYFTPYAASASSSLTDPSLEPLFWYRCDQGACEEADRRTEENGWTGETNVRVQCAADKEKFDLKAADWEEGTGQCRCQNGCDCMVEDLKDKDDAPFTKTHLLTAADVSYPPADKCDVYSWGVWNDGGEIKPTAARGTDTSRATFDVSWKDSSGSSIQDQLDQLMEMVKQNSETLATMQEENEETAAASGSGLAVGAVFLLAVAAIGYYAYHRYHRQKTAQIEANQRQPTWGDAAQANYDAIDVETHETNKEDQDTFERNVEVDVELEVQKAPPQPAAYPGGQSLPPWPYPETKPTARPTPASYDPACILKVSWPRDAARPTEDTLRETFQALAPVLNVGLGSGNAAMVVFKDAAGARAAEAAYDGPWRTAPAKPPAAAADQPPPPPPPKTGEV